MDMGDAVTEPEPALVQEAKSELASLDAAMDALRLDAEAAGCLPEDEETLSPCDWAPSVFAEGVFAYYRHQQDAAYERCQDWSNGDFARFSDTQLKDVDGNAFTVEVDGDVITWPMTSRSASTSSKSFHACMKLGPARLSELETDSLGRIKKASAMSGAGMKGDDGSSAWATITNTSELAVLAVKMATRAGGQLN